MMKTFKKRFFEFKLGMRIKQWEYASNRKQTHKVRQRHIKSAAQST